MRRFAISDIHGCARTFGALLNKINLSPVDELFLLGDFIDRGPDSKGVFDKIIQLKNLGYKIHCTLGNHEEMLLQALKNSRDIEYMWRMNGGERTLNSFHAAIVKDIPEVYLQFIDDMHICLILEDYILVHAGLNFNCPDPLEDESPMVWIRDWYGDIDRNWLGEKVIVHGHTPIPQVRILEHVAEVDQLPVINIDNGCVYNRPGHNQLCALNLDTRELTFQPNIDA
jgi:serine/threonine protein phosphatase 1